MHATYVKTFLQTTSRAKSSRVDVYVAFAIEAAR